MKENNISKKQKIYVIIVFIFGLFLGFNMGLHRSIYLILGLIIGFVLGKLDKLDKKSENKEWKKQ